MRKITIMCAFLFLPILVFADTHYVSQTGSDTYPYSTWATAADSIQKGIDASSSGDTVRVGAGTYYEGVILKSNIVLLGAGMDSCVINGNIPSEPQFIVYGADSSVVEGFHVIGRGSTAEDGGIGIYSTVTKNLKKISNNKTINCIHGIYAGGHETIVCNNITSYNSVGIGTGLASDALIINNTITHNDRGISLFYGSGYKIVRNIISYSGNGIPVFGYTMDSTLIQNNLITDLTSEFLGSSALYLSDGGSSKVVVENNTVSVEQKYKGISIGRIDADLKNNIIANASCGVEADSHSCNVVISYNDFWNNTQNYLTSGGAIIDTSLGGNVYSDPMFVNPDSDFHLQKYSPCIDAGDPNIKDIDSSRSDIGCYGGLYGESYTYQDLPPKAPNSLDASFDSVTITLIWNPNTEADLSHYLVYKDTIFNFTPDTLKIAGVVSKDSSRFKDFGWEYGKTYYYKLSAWDLTNHQSAYSDELMIKATDVPWTEETEVEIRKYTLSQNYPNPFNPTTVIVYYLPDIGYQPAEVELIIYNLLGKVVRTLVKERQSPGEYRITWDGKDDGGDDVASGIYFYRLKVSGIEFVKARKMVLIR
jgi:nitrous oxidase accessory protein NosD